MENHVMLTVWLVRSRILLFWYVYIKNRPLYEVLYWVNQQLPKIHAVPNQGYFKVNNKKLKWNQ